MLRSVFVFHDRKGSSRASWMTWRIFRTFVVDKDLEEGHSGDGEDDDEWLSDGREGRHEYPSLSLAGGRGANKCDGAGTGFSLVEVKRRECIQTQPTSAQYPQKTNRKQRSYGLLGRRAEIVGSFVLLKMLSTLSISSCREGVILLDDRDNPWCFRAETSTISQSMRIYLIFQRLLQCPAKIIQFMERGRRWFCVHFPSVVVDQIFLHL